MAGNNERGFSPLETVVAVAITSLLMLALGSLFIMVMRADARARALERESAVARQIMDRIIFELRAGSLSYAGFPGGVVPATPSTLLPIQSSDGSIVTYTTGGAGECDTGAAPCILRTDSTGSVRLTPSGMSVENFVFYIEPPGTSTAPLVTIVIEMNDVTVPRAAPFHLQTSVTTRLPYAPYR